MTICTKCNGGGVLAGGTAVIDASGNKVTGALAALSTGPCFQCNGKGYVQGGGSL